jgi:hypothetical protein
MVQEEIRKEEDAVKDTVCEDNFDASCCPTLAKRVWDLMENPHTSFAARVGFLSFLFMTAGA